MKNLEVKYVQDQITSLLLEHPELADDEVLRFDMIEGSTKAFDIIGKLIRQIGEARMQQEAIDHYLAELKTRSGRYERREEVLRKLIFRIMQAAELQRAELPEATVFLRPGQPKVTITDEEQIPADFWRIKREPDKLRIRAALMAHENVPGTVLSNAETVLAISTK